MVYGKWRTLKEMTLKPALAVLASELDQDFDSLGAPVLRSIRTSPERIGVEK